MRLYSNFYGRNMSRYGLFPKKAKSPVLSGEQLKWKEIEGSRFYVFKKCISREFLVVSETPVHEND